MLVLALMALIGIGYVAVKDFSLPSIVLAILFGLIGGLQFIPQLSIGRFYFSIGAALLFVSVYLMWMFKGKLKNRLLCLLLTVVLAGLLFGAMKISRYYGSTLWGSVNVYYGLMIGAIAFIVTRNAKYGFIASVLSVGIASVVNQIGQGYISLDIPFSPAIVAGAMAIVTYTVVAVLLPTRPNKATYYFETGRLED